MSFEIPIRHLRIEAFRGFRDPQEFDLDASAIIVSGPNGTGKTSFFDAIQWCLIGSLERVASLRAKRTVEHIVNQYRLGERASVEMELVVGSQRLKVRRVGDHGASSLEVEPSDGTRVFGDEAQRTLTTLLLRDGGPGLELALNTTGLMQQDVMRAMLQAKPADRYRHVSTVLGLGALEEFEDATKQAAKDAAATAEAASIERIRAATLLKAAQERLELLGEQMTRRPSMDALRDEVDGLLSSLPSGLSAPQLPQKVNSDDLVSLAAGAGEVAALLSGITSEVGRLENSKRTLPDEPTDEAINAALVAAELAERMGAESKSALSVVKTTLTAVERASSDVARLAAAAIPQLTNVCPVCRQTIDRAEVEAELRLRADESSAVLDARSAVAAAESAERDAHFGHESALAAHRRLVGFREAWDLYRKAEASLTFRMTNLRDSVSGFRIGGREVTDLRDQIGSIELALVQLRSRLLAALDILGDSAFVADIARSRSEVESLTEALAARQQRADELLRRSARMKALAEATVQARVEVTEERFNAVQPLVADIFSRLDPHPAFKSIEFELDTYYKKGTTSPLVRDVVEGVSADPLVIFSTSQANIAALSYFLAMGWSAGDRALPFVLLDDPVQSMDDVNVLGFADLSRHIRSARQLIVSTHDRRFAGLLERKLAPRSLIDSTLVLEFRGWDRSGPTITSRRVEPQLLDRPIRIVGAA